MLTQTPQDLIPKDPQLSKPVALSSLRSLNTTQSEGFGRRIYMPVLRGHTSSGTLFTSVLIHVAFGILLLRFPFELLSGPPPLPEPQKVNTPIYYTVRPADLNKLLPSLLPSGAGAKPGHGIHKEKPPALGSTNFHPKLTIVLTPPHPDNNHQTIIQPSSPPELKFTQDLKLPNILVGNPLGPAKPKLDPKASKGTLSRTNDKPAPDAPKIQADPTVSVVAQLSPIAQPHLLVPMSSGSVATPRSGRVATGGGGTEEESGANGLLVVSTDPAGAAQLSELLGGNRYGSFTISPAGGQPGSPGGVAGGDPHGGTGGAGTGGNGSVGVGSGTSGGGGGGAESKGDFVSIKGGSGGKAGMAGGDISYTPENMVYVVAPPPGVRSNTLIVSAGPVGGGGLGVYGALRCGRVYSVFLPMPGKSWILQYCATGAPAEDVQYQQQSSSVQLDMGLIPPHPDEKYDFKRQPVSDEMKDKMIVLRGVIGADGTMSHLEVYRGLVPEMDSMALAAFTKWKFKPALQNNKPISVDVLVGVPARVPSTK
ncbi:MAG: energy transducer TonB [Candidatus Acidiferrales bacterium]